MLLVHDRNRLTLIQTVATLQRHRPIWTTMDGMGVGSARRRHAPVYRFPWNGMN
jgi:hypothetical protein